MKKKAFTLIEMVVVVAVVGLVIPSIFAIIFGLVREQAKIQKLSTVKGEGDFILNVVANTVRNNAFTIHSASPPTELNAVCLETGSTYAGTIYFQDQEAGWFGFIPDGDLVASQSSALATALNLNSQQTIVSGFSMGCTRVNSYSAPVVSLEFDICFKTASNNCLSTRVEDTANLHYQTKIKLRNF